MTVYEILSLVLSGIISFGIGMLMFCINKAENERKERDRKRDRNMYLMYGIEEATMDLCEATAISYQRGEANGEIKAALAKVQTLRDERKAFITEQGIENLQRT